MSIDIDELRYDELIDLNHRVVERLKFLDQLKNHKSMLEFSIGERVKFRSDKDGYIYGILTKYNRKTVTIISEEGQKWNVSPTFLEKSEKNKVKGSKVVSIERKKK